ncbi:MAG: hypothetical protein ACT4PT_04175 [Methanobacteriota archaeon]
MRALLPTLIAVAVAAGLVTGLAPSAAAGPIESCRYPEFGVVVSGVTSLCCARYTGGNIRCEVPAHDLGDRLTGPAPAERCAAPAFGVVVAGERFCCERYQDRYIRC